GVLGAAVACGQERTSAPTPTPQAAPPTTPGAPPTFATSPEVGPPVSPSTFAEAEKLAEVALGGPDREMAASTWRRAMAPLLERRVGPRKVARDPAVAP